MSFQPINPKPWLQSLVDKQIEVNLKFNSLKYQGKLKSVDNYMNLLMYDVVEISGSSATEGDGKANETKIDDELFIRCNNVLYIREVV